MNEPSDPALLCRQGDALADAGRLEEAVVCYRRALVLKPDYADAHGNLGGALASLGRLAEAEQCYRRAIAIDPGAVVARYNLGVALCGLGRPDEAEHSYRAAIAHQPGFVEARYNLANLLNVRGRLEEAEVEFRELLALKPDYVEAHNNRGIVLAGLGRLGDAERSYRQALALRPGHALAHNNLGNVLRESGRHEEAEQCYRQAIALNPGLADAYSHHGNALLDLGRLEEAEACHRRAVALNPRHALALSNLLLFLSYVPGRSPAEIFAEHREFGRRFEFTPEARPHENSPDPDRKLRIGYVSGDLRVHSVAFFIEPVLAHHDRGRFEVLCYHNFPRADGVTQRLKAYADHWRDVHALDDDALARQVRADAIDILIDLSGHTANNRLAAFARRPAPVQATWLGYPATTGLAAMDYRLTDAFADPVAESDRWFVERLIRLPEVMWCFRSDGVVPEAAPAPVPERAKVTFGSFNYYAKLNTQVIALWARLLERLPGSRMIVTRIPGVQTEQALQKRFEQSGIARDRLELHGILPRAQFAGLLARTDIALDPFPYAGTTTTCDALSMGIPVVTLAGETTAARSGASLLRAVGLGELVASSTGNYLEIAEALARDPQRLAGMHRGLRERVTRSLLADARRFTANLEAAYRDMWKHWCGAGKR